MRHSSLVESERTPNGAGNRAPARGPVPVQPLAYQLRATPAEDDAPVAPAAVAEDEPRAAPVDWPRVLTIVLGAATAVSLVAAAVLWLRVGTLNGRLHELQRADQSVVGAASQQALLANGLAARVKALELRASEQPDPASVVAKRVRASVFVLETSSVQGSAWAFFSSRGTTSLVTDYHVVSDAWNAGRHSITVKQNGAVLSGTIARVDVADDLALITVPGTFPVLDRATAAPRIGDSVLVVGAPLGLDESVTNGIVSAERTENGHDYLQFSAPISPGNSGGPVVDDRGRVVGITVAKFAGTGAEGLSLAIPVAHVCHGLVSC